MINGLLKISLLSFLLISCSITKVRYKIRYTEAKNEKKSIKVNNYRADDFEEGLTLYSLYQGNLFFGLENSSDSPIEIIWEESRLIDPFGKSQRLIPSSTKVNRNGPKYFVTTVASKQTFTCLLTTLNNIIYARSKWHDLGPIRRKFLTGEAEAKRFSEQVVNKDFVVMIVLKKNGRLLNYSMNYKILNSRTLN